MKRVFSAILALIIVLSLVPAGKVRAVEPDTYEMVEQQMQDYAASINQTDAAKTAATALLTNAAFRGKDLSYDESSAMTAMIFNSVLFQEGMTHSLTEMIRLMQKYRNDSMLAVCGLNWYSSSANFSTTAYSEPVLSQEYYLGCVTSSEMVYGNRTELVSRYNSNDKMLVMVAGSTQADYIITRSDATGDTAIYDIEMKIYDDFDYNANYNESDYNRDFEKILSMFGGLTMSSFYWEINVSFQIEVPYYCDHTFASYRWEFDAESLTLSSDISGGFRSNPAQYQLYTTTNSDGETRTSHYYRLEDHIFLSHDQPWVVQYEIQGSMQFTMAGGPNITRAEPFIFQNGYQYS